MLMCDYRTSVLSHGLGFNTSSLSSLNINVTTLGRTYSNTALNTNYQNIEHFYIICLDCHILKCLSGSTGYTVQSTFYNILK